MTLQFPFTEWSFTVWSILLVIVRYELEFDSPWYTNVEGAKPKSSVNLRPWNSTLTWFYPLRNCYLIPTNSPAMTRTWEGDQSVVAKDAILLTIDQWCTQCRLANHSCPALVKSVRTDEVLLTSRPIVVWKECMYGVMACKDICSSKFAVGMTVSSCLMVSMSAFRASVRLVSIGVSRILVSYDRTRGGGFKIQAISNTKWSRACRKCLPVKGQSEFRVET